jgi:hypothetical protein
VSREELSFFFPLSWSTGSEFRSVPTGLFHELSQPTQLAWVLLRHGATAAIQVGNGTKRALVLTAAQDSPANRGCATLGLAWLRGDSLWAVGVVEMRLNGACLRRLPHQPRLIAERRLHETHRL